jgi:anti-sigma factor RsiW
MSSDSGMTCRDLVEFLIDYLSDELPIDRRRRIEQHLKDCPPCEAYLKTYRLTIKLTRQLPRSAPPPPQLMERLRAAAQGLAPRQPPAGGCC